MNSFMRRNITAEQMHSFLKDKEAWENAISMYNGPDPLEHWYNYICWYYSNIQGDPENKFRETLERCLTQYEHIEYYKQDPRMVKLWIRYIAMQQNPLHFYQILYQRGIGRQCACFYTNWAHLYDSANALKEAESIYKLGFQAKAEPYAELEGAHTKFLYSLSQRMVYEDKKLHNSNIQHSQQHHHQQQQQQHQQIPITQPLEKRSIDVNHHPQHHQQQQQHIPEQHCNQQFQQQPHHIPPEVQSHPEVQTQTPPVATNTNCQYTELQSSTATAISSSLNYIYNEPQAQQATNVYPQDPATFGAQPLEVPLGNVKLPTEFATYCRNNYEVWKPALFLEEPEDPCKRCMYQKASVYPGGDVEFSPEELRAKKWKNNQQKSRPAVQPQSQPQPVANQKPPIATAETHEPDFEDQIEASTIRFSTLDEEHGVTKSKTIKIKFKKEKDTSCSSTNGQSNYNYTIENNYASDTAASQDDGGLHRGNGFHPYQMQTSTPKVKKPKKLKNVNKHHHHHQVGKFLTTHGDSNSSDYQPQQQSQYQYEDANLLLTFAKENTSSSTTLQQQNQQQHQQLQHRTPIKIRQKNGDSVHYTAANDNASFSFNETAYLDNSNCSVSSAVGRLNFRDSQRDDFSTYAENSFFASENDKELQEQRLEKALAVIETHMAKPVIDPFNNELCKAFLTKLNFPSYETADNVYKVVSTPLPKFANTKMITLADTRFSIEKEVGRGSYGSVYKANDLNTGTVVALKYQKPPNIWEIYICHQVRQRIKTETVLPGVMNISSAVIAPNASIIATEFSPYGSLLDINNKIRQATKKVMHESLVMHFSSQILNIIHCLHKSKIIHADIKPDNFLLMRVPNTDLHYPSLRLIDFGCALDMTLFPERTQFRKIIQTDGFTCIEMQEGRPWSYETDLFCVAGTVHVMLFGEYMQISKKFETWDIKQKLPRYLKKHVWTDFFGSMLNIKSQDILPNLLDIKMRFDEEAMKMDSELQSQIRTLSNLLHRR